MPDFFDPSLLETDWWDVPADYFTGGLDLSGGLDPSLYSLTDPGFGTGSLDWLGDSGIGSTGGFGMDLGLDTQWLDTLTGQIVTGAQAKILDPISWEKAIKYGIGGATALGGLGAVGLGIGSLFGGSDAANRTQTQTSAAGQGPRSPEAMQLLGSGGGAPGLPGAAGGGGAGLLGLSDMMLQNLMGSGQGGAPGGAPGLGQPAPGAQIGQIPPGGGAMALPQGQSQTWPAGPGAAGGQPSSPQQGQPGLIGQQANVLGGLQSQIPQLNPAIMQALGLQAQGMAQGYLPSLSDPQAQARIQSIYQPGFDALNYNSGLALSNAREQLQQRGFQAPDIREGPTQALTAPILAAQQLGRSQLYGQMAGAQLDLASRLPMLGSQLNAQNWASQAQPFGLGTQLAGAYNQPIATQGQFPLSLLDILERGRGSTSTVNTVGPQPSLTQQLGQVAPLVGAGGNLLSSAGSMLFPQSQNPYGSPRYDPFTGRLLSGV